MISGFACGLQIRVQEFDSPTRLQCFQWVSVLSAHWVSPSVSVSCSVLVLFWRYLRLAAACRARMICLASPAYLTIIAFDVWPLKLAISSSVQPAQASSITPR